MKVDLTEDEFYAIIDANLPYQRPVAVNALIRIGTGYSANMAFVVLNEICRPPHPNTTIPKILLDYLEVWEQVFDHPLKSDLVGLARILISQSYASAEAAMYVMHKIADYPGQYAALCIAYMSCDDIDGVADRLYEEIVAAWKVKA